MRLLIAEDNEKLLHSLICSFEQEQYLVDGAADGLAALELAGKHHYDGMILDLMMPGLDGISLLQRIRQEGNGTPALFLSARSELDDRIAGLEAGADDYLPKPFAMSELSARVRALTRRHPQFAASSLSFLGVTLDKHSGKLQHHNSAVSVYGKEFLLLEQFFRHPGQILTAEYLMGEIWNSAQDASLSSLAVHLSNIRKKLRSVQAPLVLRSIRNQGYSLEPQEGAFR